jgi:hypothetical protein
MKSSHHFFSHLGMPTQFSDSKSPVSVLHGTNLYSSSSVFATLLRYFLPFFVTPWSLPSISAGLHYPFPGNGFITLTVNESSSRTLSLHRSTSTTNFPWLFPSVNCLTVLLGTLLYSRGTDTYHRKYVTWPLLFCDVTANHRKHMSCHPYIL